MTTFRNQPSQVTSSYWDPANMASWGIQGSKSTKPTAVVKVISPLPPPTTSTVAVTICPAAAGQEPVTTTSQPYIPPHLTTICDSVMLITSTTVDISKARAVSLAAPHATTSAATIDVHSASTTHRTTRPVIATNTINQTNKTPTSSLPLPTNPKAAALRTWLDNDLATPRSHPCTPSQLSHSNSSTLSDEVDEPFKCPYGSISPLSSISSLSTVRSTTTGAPFSSSPPQGVISYTPPSVRPAKTADVARRMICHDLGIKVPRNTGSEQAGYW